MLVFLAICENPRFFAHTAKPLTGWRALAFPFKVSLLFSSSKQQSGRVYGDRNRVKQTASFAAHSAYAPAKGSTHGCYSTTSWAYRRKVFLLPNTAPRPVENGWLTEMNIPTGLKLFIYPAVCVQ